MFLLPHCSIYQLALVIIITEVKFVIPECQLTSAFELLLVIMDRVPITFIEFVKVIRQLSKIDGKRLLQIVAIFCIMMMMSIIIHKGHSDISHIIAASPDDILPSLGKYFIDNLAGIGAEKLMKQ